VSSNDDNNGAYAVITGPGRGPLPRDFAPAKLSRAEVDRLLDMARSADDGSDPRKTRKERPARPVREPSSTPGGVWPVMPPDG